MIILVVLDTSLSMGQVTQWGLSLIDYAKSAVEHLVKCRTRELPNRDQFILATCGEGSPAWKDPTPKFLVDVKMASAKDPDQDPETGCDTLSISLCRAINFLNTFRAVDAENLGKGRIPWFSESSMIVVLTGNDPGLDNVPSPILEKLGIEKSVQKGEKGQTQDELTPTSLLKWDQRVFSIVLRLPPRNPSEVESPSESRNAPSCLASISELSGGKLHAVQTSKSLMQTIESVAKTQDGVICNFHPLTSQNLPPFPLTSTPSTTSSFLSSSYPVTSTPGRSLRKVLSLKKSAIGTWPIPETYLPSQALTELPPRSIHPNIIFAQQAQAVPELKSRLNEPFPRDRYEIEVSPLYELMASDPSQTCRPTYIFNSNGTNLVGRAFGYLKRNRNGKRVLLHILPYDYPTLFSLINEYQTQGHQLTHFFTSPPGERWKAGMLNYLKSVPLYYIPILKTAFIKMNFQPQILTDLPPILHQLLSDTQPYPSLSSVLFSSTVNDHLSGLQRHQDQLQEWYKNQQNHGFSNSNKDRKLSTTIIPTAFPFPSPLHRLLSSTSTTITKIKAQNNEDTSLPLLISGLASVIGIKLYPEETRLSRNPFDIRRGHLIRAMDKLRNHVLESSPLASSTFNLYDTYLLKTDKPNLKQDPLKISIPAPNSTSDPTSTPTSPATPTLRLHPRSGVVDPDEEAKHYLPVADMGNYMAVLKKQPVLRDPFADEETRRTSSKYRGKGKLGARIVDEAEDLSSESAVFRKRGTPVGVTRKKRDPLQRPSFTEFLRKRQEPSSMNTENLEVKDRKELESSNSTAVTELKETSGIPLSKKKRKSNANDRAKRKKNKQTPIDSEINLKQESVEDEKKKSDIKTLSTEGNKTVSSDTQMKVVRKNTQLIDIDFSKLNFGERSLRRRAFWEENQLFEFRVIFTRQLRIRKPASEKLFSVYSQI